GIKRKMENEKWKMENYSEEKSFYNAIGLEWIPPEIRENTGEIELAVAHKLPKLIELKDIKGDLHLHSNFPIEPSHDLGTDTFEAMIEKAREFGYKYLGFSEHNPSVSKHTSSQIYEIIAGRNERIEQIKLSIKDIRIINLLEVDILANGNLALNDKILEKLDAVIVSIHSAFSMDKRLMTKRIVAGLSHPKAKILAHPTGRKINERSGYNMDFDKIFDFCIKNNKALEINSYPSRLDLPDAQVRHAVDLGIKMVINTDSHAAWQMTNMRYGISVARRGWAKKDDILNSLPYNELIAWIQKK
ncbi:MAG: DNA polymerase III, partial [bacterium]|nr:DNA polymerase III [bacterium]